MVPNARWLLAPSLVLALLALPAVASAQDSRSLAGTWEGFSSLGNFVVIEVSAADDGSMSANVSVQEGGIGGTPRAEAYALAVTDVDAIHTRVDVGGELGTLDIYWYSDDAVRLQVAPEVIVSLARVTVPESSALFGIEPAPEGDEPAPEGDEPAAGE